MPDLSAFVTRQWPLARARSYREIERSREYLRVTLLPKPALNFRRTPGILPGESTMVADDTRLHDDS